MPITMAVASDRSRVNPSHPRLPAPFDAAFRWALLVVLNEANRKVDRWGEGRGASVYRVGIGHRISDETKQQRARKQLAELVKVNRR